MSERPSDVTTHPSPSALPTCYRHGDRPTGARCTRCGRSTCPECMREAPVGHHCVDCVREANRGVRQVRSPFGSGGTGGGVGLLGQGLVVRVLIALNVTLFVAQFTGAPLARYVMQPLAVADGEWWRLITAAFLHGGVLHVAFNMYALYSVGSQVEAVLGRWRFLALYLVAALGGSALSYVLSNPRAQAVGASGAVFGLFGAMFVIARLRRLDTSQIVTLVIINLMIGFAVPRIDNNAHIGGLLAGGLLAFLLAKAPQGPQRVLVQGLAVVGLVAVLAVVILWRTAALAGS